MLLYVAQSSWELEKPLFCSDSQATNISAKAPDITQGSTASLILEFKKVDCMIVDEDENYQLIRLRNTFLTADQIFYQERFTHKTHAKKITSILE